MINIITKLCQSVKRLSAQNSIVDLFYPILVFRDYEKISWQNGRACSTKKCTVLNNWNTQLRIDTNPGCWYVAILLPVDQYTTVVHASGHRLFSGHIRRVSHLASGNDYPLPVRQDARALEPLACQARIEGRHNVVPIQRWVLFSEGYGGTRGHTERGIPPTVTS